MSNELVFMVRLSHPALAEMKPDQSGKMSYNLSINLDPVVQAAEVSQLYATMGEVAAEKWGPQYADLTQVKNFISMNPATDPYFPGFYKFSAKSHKNQPKLMMQNGEVVPQAEIENVLYAGCNVAVQIQVYGIDSVQRTIAFSLDFVMKLSDNESFGNAAVLSDAMKGLIDPNYVHNPIAAAVATPPPAAPAQQSMFSGPVVTPPAQQVFTPPPVAPETPPAFPPAGPIVPGPGEVPF